jgi:aspartyl-tRNA(Asn)/glutamyl-tRNA(Gln) amidotransferase subunit A
MIYFFRCVEHDNSFFRFPFKEYFPLELDQSVIPPIRRVLASAKALGASLIPVFLPSTSYALSAYYVIASAEASSNMARYDGVQYGMIICVV